MVYPAFFGIFSGFSWFLMNFTNLSVGLPWFFMGLPWFSQVFPGFSWFLLTFPWVLATPPSVRPGSAERSHGAAEGHGAATHEFHRAGAGKKPWIIDMGMVGLKHISFNGV